MNQPAVGYAAIDFHVRAWPYVDQKATANQNK